MSFNAKNLSYEKNEPAFLRRLKGQYGDGNSARRDRPDRRPARIKSTDEDDEPTYVVEGSNEVLSKEEYEKLLKGEDKEEQTGDAPPDADADVDKKAPAVEEGRSSLKTQQKVVEIGGSKKRKQGKVVSNDKAADVEANTVETQKPQMPPRLSGKKKAKNKKVKLSFDEE